MNIRLGLIILISAALGGISFLNWDAITTPSEVSLGYWTVSAPLGLIILGLSVLLAVLFLAYVLWLQANVLMETLRHNKEMATQRDLADKAEASRFTELREFLVVQNQENQARVLEQLQVLENHLLAKVDESDNTTAAYMGQLEDRLRQQRATNVIEHHDQQI